MMIRNDKKPRLVVGHVGPNEARIWGRGDARNPVMFLKASGEDKRVIEKSLVLSQEDGYSGVIDLEGLSASTDYSLTVSYGASKDTPTAQRAYSREGQLETTPAAGQDEPFSMLLNSCNFHGWGPFRSNDKANIRRAQVAEGVDMILHTGDQVYADKAPISFSLAEFRRSYDRAWSDEGVPEVLSSQANYMLPDDHEVVNGFAEGGSLTKLQRALLWLRGHGGPEREQYEEMGRNGLKAFAEFQRSHGPSTHGSDVNYYTFSHGNHQFFALDTGLNRRPEEGEMISAKQKEALFSWLTEHRDQPKFIVTSTPFVMEYKNPRDKWTSPEWNHQRDEIIDFLATEELDNVVFLAGDVHASGHATMTIKTPSGKEIVIDELTSSAINASVMRGRDKFVGTREGSTESGTAYKVALDEESFLGKDGWGISNSNVMRIDVDGNRISYQTFRTRKGEEDAVRAGEFLIADSQSSTARK